MTEAEKASVCSEGQHGGSRGKSEEAKKKKASKDQGEQELERN